MVDVVEVVVLVVVFEFAPPVRERMEEEAQQEVLPDVAGRRCYLMEQGGGAT